MKGCRPLSQEEVDLISKSFWGRYEKRDRAIFLLGIKSGFRISEILSLRVKDVRSKRKMGARVHVARQNMKKKTEGRSILLHPEAKTVLKEWLEQLESEGTIDENAFIFQSQKRKNRPVSRQHVWHILRVAFESNEMDGKLGTHSMRKTFADRIYAALDSDLIKTQRALGHKNINSTVSYLSFREEEIDQAVLAI